MLTTTEMTVRELLETYTGVLDELESRGLIRTRNAPVGDLVERAVAEAYAGTLAPNSERSFDVTASDGRLLQVKARLLDRADGRTHVFSPFRTWTFDAAVLVVLDRSYAVRWAREISTSELQVVGKRREHLAAWLVNTRAASSLGIDVTDRVRAAFDSLG